MRQTLNMLGAIISKNSPAILTGLSVAGLITTVVFAVKATPKALEIIDDLQLQEPVEIVKETYKLYLPAIGMGAVTVACMIGATSISLRRNAALVSVYKLGETAMKEYRAKVVEQLGKPKEKELRDSIARDRVEANPVTEKNLIVTGKGETLCYDALSGRYFKSDIETIRQVLNKLSRDMMSEQTVSLNQIYSDLDLEETKLGDEMGWHIDDGLIDPSFSSHLANGIPCLVLDFETPPRYQPW